MKGEQHTMTEREIITAQSQFVVMRNELIQKSRYDLTLTEQKIILFMVSKITPLDEPYKEYEFTYKEFESVCNLNRDGGKPKRLVIDALKQLRTKPVEITLSENKKVITGWFNEATIDTDTQTVSIVFSKHLVPYLYNLQTFYTMFCLENVLPMNSKYAIRLYEYLKSIKSKGYKQTVALEELRERCGVGDKYTKYKDLRVNVIEPALADINTYTDLEVKYKEIKTSRSITHLEFTILNYDTPERRINRSRELRDEGCENESKV